MKGFVSYLNYCHSNIQVEISALEVEIRHNKKRLVKSFEDNECFEKTKTIFHELKSLTDKLALLKNAHQLKMVK